MSIIGRFRGRGTVPGQACRYGRLRHVFGVAGKQGVSSVRQCACTLPSASGTTDSADSCVHCTNPVADGHG